MRRSPLIDDSIHVRTSDPLCAGVHGACARLTGPSWRRRAALCGIAVSMMFFAAGCASNRFKPAVGHQVSTEEVSSVLISGDGSQLVALTPRRHFVFQAPAGLSAALRSRFHPRLSGDFGVVSIEPDASVSVRVTLSMPAGGPEDWREAQAMGFNTKYGDPSTWELDVGLMRGVVYKANGVTLPPEALKLNRTYQIKVAATGAGLRYRDLPSPVRMIGEGALGMVLAPLAIVATPLVLILTPKGVGVGP